MSCIRRTSSSNVVVADCVVEEVGLARNISLLCKALGDDGEAYIETIRKRGYRSKGSSASARSLWVAAKVRYGRSRSK